MHSDDRDSRGERESGSPSPSDTSEREEVASAKGSGGERPDNSVPTNGSREDSGAHEPEQPGTGDTSSSQTLPPPAPYYDDPYENDQVAPPKAVVKSAPAPPAPPAPPSNDGEEPSEEEEGMARMSFLEHLEELRTRIIRALAGLVEAYLGCLIFANTLFTLIKDPFDRAVASLPPGSDAKMVQSTAMEGFQLIYLHIPLLAAIFVAAPWLMYPAWAFHAPGLYKRERRWDMPFILSTAGLFILGGVFGYFVALKFALAFLVGISQELGVSAYISMSTYFDNFVGIMLGLGLVFQMPILIFFLTLISILTPRFLLNNVRYAILVIFVLAAVITPTPDVFNMILFAGPMILLFYVGIGASYILVFRREKRSIPWGRIILVVLLVFALIAGVVYYMHTQLGFEFVRQAPFFIRR